MMIFTSALSLRNLRQAFVALALTLPALGHAADWNIDQLMRSLAQTHSGHVGFVEKKSIAMLDKPVESSGELFYSAPDHLEKRTIKPKSESMIVDGDELLIDRGRQKYRLQLQDYPELAAFLDSIRGTLAGDRKALERNYQLSLDGTAAHWTLQLLPLNEKMQKVIQRIRITGTHDQVNSIEITQADGDSSVMTITKLAAP
ncbi:acyltransferase [Sulfuriferula sp. AH1]|uniref:LolA-related protein n=1 Tax=Sulfuriferula sp. AH1 TaxID=1985873 RepID=UPI000B3B960C|nr:LolA-related protein [Sulfuriferula sp. AH1]ARU31059.1 acyltransferase [Sulfuriferula sp. AH1]